MQQHKHNVNDPGHTHFYGDFYADYDTLLGNQGSGVFANAIVDHGRNTAKGATNLQVSELFKHMSANGKVKT